MSKSVFISHSSKDAAIALEVCALLEAQRIECWIAPRDIVPGASYGVTIEAAIRSCSVCLLILSPNALSSNAVESEIERAFHYQRTIIPLRIKNVEPGDKLALFISKAQWLDAFSAPIKDRVDHIAAVVQAVENNREAPKPPPERAGLIAKLERRLETAFRHKVLSIVGAVTLLAALSAGGLILQRQTQQVVEGASSAIRKAAQQTDRAAERTTEAARETTSAAQETSRAGQAIQRSAENVQQSATEIRETGSRVVEAVNPTISPSQFNDALVAAVRGGRTDEILRLVAQGARLDELSVNRLIGPVLQDIDRLRNLVDAIRVAAGPSANALLAGAASGLGEDLEHLARIGEADDDIDDGEAIIRFCSRAGSDTGFWLGLRDTIATPDVCEDGIRAQSLSSTFIERARATERAARELGGRSPQRDWMLTVLSPFLNTRSARNPDARREFRTFVSPEQLETANQDVLRAAPPIPSTLRVQPGFLQNPREAEQFVTAGTIVVVEARFFNQVGYMGANDWFALEDHWGAYTQRQAGALTMGTVGIPTPPNLAPFGGAGNELRRPLPTDLARDFQRCWGQQVYEGSGANSRHSRSARSTCHVRLAVVLRNPLEKQWLGFLRYTLLDEPGRRGETPANGQNSQQFGEVTTVSPAQQAAEPGASSPPGVTGRPDAVGLGELAPANLAAIESRRQASLAAPEATQPGAAQGLAPSVTPPQAIVAPPAPAIASPPAQAPATTPLEQLVGLPPVAAPETLQRALGAGAQRRMTATVNARVRPDTNAPILFEVQPGAVVEVVQLVAGGDWAQVVVERQVVGFIRVTALERNSGAPTLGAASPVGVAAPITNPPGWPLIIPGPVSVDLNERRRLCSRGNLRRDMLQLTDLDGDGVSDFLLNDSAGCDEAQTQNCGATGVCNLTVFLSSHGFRRVEIFGQRGVRIVSGRGGAQDLILSLPGSMCDRAGFEQCEKRYSWSRTRFVETR